MHDLSKIDQFFLVWCDFLPSVRTSCKN